MSRTVEAWMEEPLRRFVQDSGASLALIANTSGQVMGQIGFTRAVDVMAACALAAAINASSAELGRMLDGKPFGGLHQPGATRQTYLGSSSTVRGAYLFLTVFDEASSLGLVRVFYDEFRARFAEAAPPVEATPRPVLVADFEHELNRNLATLFGKAS